MQWLGHVSDDAQLFSLWQHAGAYFHGHSVGGTNPALVQAMACGAPVVARDTVYNREVLAEAGVFVEPTPHAIASALTSLMNDSAAQAQLSEFGVIRSASHYTWDTVNGKYESSLSELVGT